MSKTGLLLISFWLTSVTSLQAQMQPQSETPPQAGGIYRVGGGVSAPVAIYKIEPEYSEEARKAKFQGTVVLSIVVDEQGLPRNFKVVKPLGLGLDEKAIEAVQKWRFSPAKLNGKPVAVQATVEINFRLLLGKDHDGQIARLNFTLPPGAARPEIAHGELPGNPATSGDQSLRIRIQVDEEGNPQNAMVLESTDADWAQKALGELLSWRFRPALADGHPVPVEGVFDLTHGGERRPMQMAAAPAAGAVPTAIPNPVSAEDFYRNASAALSRHDAQGAVQALDEAIRLKPEFASAYYLRARAHLTLKGYREAIQDANQEIRLNPSGLRGYLLRGEAYGNLGQHAKALEDYNLYIEKRPDSAAACNDLGWAYNELGETAKAVQALNRAIELDPAYGRAHENRGLAYLKLHEWAKAENDLSTAIQIRPSSGWAYARRAEARDGKGDAPGAEADRAKARALDGAVR